MASIYEQVKTAQVNSFTGGMNTDLHPMVQPSDTMTDCLNGTLITYQGNENIIQNDMGNYELKNAKLPEGYIPLGMKEHNGIIYIVSTNPITGKTQIGSYPSPQTLVEDGDPIERSIKEIEIPEIEGFNDKTNLFEHLATNGYTALTNKAESIIFSDLFDDMTQITNNDKYELVNSSNDKTDDSEFQYDQFFILDSDNKITNIDPPKTEDNFNGDSEDIKTNVSWDIPGWLGFKHKLYTPKKHIQNISGGILKTISTANYSIIDNQLLPNGDNGYKFGIKTDSEYTLDFSEVCKLVKNNEFWFQIKPSINISNKYKYSVVSHNFISGEGIIEFETPLIVQPEIFRSDINTINFPTNIEDINLNRQYLGNVNTIIVGSTIKNISVRHNTNLTIIISGKLSIEGVTISCPVNSSWDDSIKITVIYDNINDIHWSDNIPEKNRTVNTERPEEYNSDRIESYIKYTSSREARICNGLSHDRYFDKFTFNYDLTDVRDISIDVEGWGYFNTIILPETIITNFDSFSGSKCSVYYSSQYAGIHYDKSDIEFYDYYTKSHYITEETPEKGADIKAFDGFIKYEIKKQIKQNNGLVPAPSIISSTVLDVSTNEYHFNVQNIEDAVALYFNFKQYFIDDGILYTIIDIDSNSFQWMVNLFPNENGIISTSDDTHKNKKQTGNSFTVSNVLYKCPIIEDLTKGICYRITASNSDKPYTNIVRSNENSETITINTTFNSGVLNDVNINTESILIESVPFYAYDNKVLILDNLKEDDTILLKDINKSDINARRFQYKKDGDKITVTLELNKVVDRSLYTAKLYQFKNGKLLNNVANPEVNTGFSEKFEVTFTINNKYKDIPFFIFSIDDLYKGIIVNTDDVNKEDHKLQYDDYNLIPNILTINPAQNDSINVSNPRVVYMYIPEGVVDNNKIDPQKCSKITYYNKPWILSKQEVQNVCYLGVGVIGDITINNELLLDNNVTSTIPYNIHNNNIVKLTESNTYTILCSYQIFPYKMMDNDNGKYANYLTREYLLRSTYSPFTLMKEKVDKNDPNDTGLNYKLTPELINYAEWGATKYENASKIINIEKQSGKNVGTHIEVVTNYEGLVDNIKGNIYTTNFSNLLSQLKKKQLFYFFNCQVKTKDNGLVIPFPLMYNDGMEHYYWSDILNGIKNVPETNKLAALTATRKSEWLPSSSFMKKFKDRGLSNTERILSTIGASIAVGTLASYAISMSILNGIPVAEPIIATVVAVIGLIFFLGKMKLKDRYWVFLGLRFKGKDPNIDKAPFIIPMWGSRKKSRAYMITNSDDLERAEQRLMTFCKNVYYLRSEPFGNNKSIIIPTIGASELIYNYTADKNDNTKYYFGEEIKLESREVFNTQYEGVYLSELPQLLSDLIGHTNNNVSVNSNNKLTIRIKMTDTEPIDNLIKAAFDNLEECLELQFLDYKNTESPSSSKFKLDTDEIKEDTNIYKSINSVLDNLMVDSTTGQWYFKYPTESYTDHDFNMLSVQGNRGRKWRTLWTWINGKKKKVHAGEEVTSEDGYAPIARPCNPEEGLDNADTFMVPNDWNNENSNSWKEWKDASQLNVPRYLTFLSTIYGAKEL